MDTVTVDYVGPVQRFRVTCYADHAERVSALLPHCHYGPDYKRGVADDLGRAQWAAIKGERESATYWLESAEQYLASLGA